MQANDKTKKRNSQYKAFNILLKSELSEFSFFKLKGDMFSKIAKLLVLAISFVALIFIYKFLLYFYEQLGIRVYVSLIPMIMLIYTIISVFQTLSGLTSQLFEDPRLEILITFPIHSYIIYLVKIISKYISELMKTAFFLLPLLLAFHMHTKLQLSIFPIYLTKIFYIILILPAFIILLSSVLMFLFHWIKVLLSKSKIVIFILLAVGIGLIFYFLTRTVNSLLDLDGFIRAEIFYRKWGALNRWCEKFILNETFITKWLYYLLFRRDTLGGGANLEIKPIWQHLLYPFLAVVMLGVVSLGVLYFVYFELLNTKKMSRVLVKRKHNLFLKIKNIYLIFLLKEIFSNLRDSRTLFQNVVYLFVFPFITYLLNKIFFHLDLHTFGYQLVFLINIFIGLLVVTTSNSLAASFITKEGGMAPLLKIYPGNTKKIIFAKLSINFFINATIILINLIILISFNPFLGSKSLKLAPLLIFLILIIYSTINLLISSMEDLKKPEYNKYQYYKDTNKIKNITTSIMLGLLTSFVIISVIMLAGLKLLLVSSSAIIVVGILMLSYIIYQYHKRVDVYFQGLGG